MGILLLLIVGALGAWKTVRLVQAVEAARRELGVATEELTALQENPQTGSVPTPADMKKLAFQLARTADALSVLRTEVGPLGAALRLARPLPATLSWIADVPDLLDVAIPLTAATSTASQLLASVLETEGPEAPPTRMLSAVLKAVAGALPELTGALDTAEQPAWRLSDHPLGGPLEPLDPIVQRVTRALSSVRAGVELAAALAPIVAGNRPQTFLLLGQNEREIRPTGGFIGSAGTVTIAGGQITELTYGSSYTMDAVASPPVPPGPLRLYLGLGGWYLRDSNWWPDFPASAVQAEQAWERAGHEPVDGVIAFDVAAFKRMLSIIGPVEVPGYGPVDSESFEAVEVTARYVETRVAGFAENTNAFLKAFGTAFESRVLELPLPSALALVPELGRLLDEKHVQVVVKDPALMAQLRARAWDGSLATDAADPLAIIDANVSYSKTYPSIRTTTAIHIQIGFDGTARHRIDLEYANSYPEGLPDWLPPDAAGSTFDPATGTVRLVPGFWGDWLRLYLPANARQVLVEGLDAPAPITEELGRVVAAGYLPLGPGERRHVHVEYVTEGPMPQADAPYTLLWQRQAGPSCRPVSLTVAWPDGRSANAAGCPTRDAAWELRPGAASAG